MIENKHKCPVKLWRKFTDKGKIAYNNVRGVSQGIIYPKETVQSKTFEVISHNYACFAAWEFQH